MSEVQQSIGVIHLSNVRVSHLYCFEPYVGKPTPQIPNPKPVYKADFLLPPTHPDLVRVAAVVEAVGAAKQWKAAQGVQLSWAQVKEQLKAQDKMCLHRGDVTAAGQPEYAGMFFVKGNNYKPFSIFDGDRSILTAKDGRPYSGCYVNAIIDIYAQDNQFGRRINATITGIQYLSKGDAFGAGPPPAKAEEFGVVAANADQATPTAGVDPLAGLV